MAHTAQHMEPLFFPGPAAPSWVQYAGILLFDDLAVPSLAMPRQRNGLKRPGQTLDLALGKDGRIDLSGGNDVPSIQKPTHAGSTDLCA